VYDIIVLASVYVRVRVCYAVLSYSDWDIAKSLIEDNYNIDAHTITLWYITLNIGCLNVYTVLVAPDILSPVLGIE